MPITYVRFARYCGKMYKSRLFFRTVCWLTQSAVCISSYDTLLKVWKALKKLTLLLCCPNLPGAFGIMTRYTHA